MDDVDRVRSITVTARQLKKRRAEILAALGVTLADLTERAGRYQLVGQEHDAWQEIEEIQFLLGDLN